MYACAYRHYIVRNIGTTFQSYTKTWSTSIAKCLKPLKNTQIILPKQDAGEAIPHFNNTVARLKDSETTSSPRKSLRGGSLSMPKALRRRQANSPVRSFPHKNTEVRDGRGQELPSNSDPEPNCQDVFGHTKTGWWRSDSQPKSVLRRNRKPTDNSFPWQQRISQNSSRFVWVLAIHKGMMKVFSILTYLICLATTCIVNPCYSSIGKSRNWRSPLCQRRPAFQRWKLMRLQVFLCTKQRWYTDLEVYARQMQVQIPNKDTLHDRIMMKYV